MRVLVACEFSGIVRDAFAARGHDAWSCDLEPSERGGKHLHGDIFQMTDFREWDLVIAFPPCTHLCSSGARWWREKQFDGRQDAAIEFVQKLWRLGPKKMLIENPIGILSTAWRKPDQIIHPWQFGHGETKATCLWRRGLPPLKPTRIVNGREARVHRMPPSPTRARERSRTYEGIARAMAEQWG